MQLRQLSRRLEQSPPSPERDELLGRTRRRLAEIEAPEELGPPTSHPALPDELALPLLETDGLRE
jgi:hypothetical protein